eukprot:TRINITY_DN19824_c0_g1_i1.p1 TRINITY_DN19824_c0_g1~~TRINITY_DN19824_c0_g1_i1.p1  ORF type:complete len:456 (+),score=62.78 TRINITY_DN19824_c0_g1_i1:95-1462(+)
MRCADGRPSAAAAGESAVHGGHGAGTAHGKGRGCGKGAAPANAAQSVAAAAAAAAPPGGALAALSAICAYEPLHGEVLLAPELATDRRVVDCSVGYKYTTLLTDTGTVFCHMEKIGGQLCAGGDAQRALPAPLPWPAATVSCGSVASAALRRGGSAVCNWVNHGFLVRGRGGVVPIEVAGLPPSDPVTLLASSVSAVIAITESGEAYGWGKLADLAPPGSLVASAPQARRASVRVLPLCGRPLRRLALAQRFGVAETRSGELLEWGRPPSLGPARSSMPPLPPRPLQPRAGRLAHPLRSLAAGGDMVIAADAGGRLWCMAAEGELARAALPRAERAVRAAAIGEPPLAVALTGRGRLWVCSPTGFCRELTVAAPLPQWTVLLPYGGCAAQRIVFIPDTSCGQSRCRLLLLIAGRYGLLPGGEMRRAALVPFFVDEDWIFDGPSTADSAGEESGAE